MKKWAFLALVLGVGVFSVIFLESSCSAQKTETKEYQIEGQTEEEEMQRVNEMINRDVLQSRQTREAIQKEQETKELDKIRRGQ